jgi:hypothetical protein
MFQPAILCLFGALIQRLEEVGLNFRLHVDDLLAFGKLRAF